MLPAVVLLSGCGSDTASDGNTIPTETSVVSEPTVQIAGAAMKGVIQQGLVVANRLVSDSNGVYRLQQEAAEPVLTADDGSYQWKLEGKAEGWILVELKADGGTRMICDVMPQCDQAGIAPVPFGQAMSLDSSFSLRGAGDLQMETVNLTPLTHLAVTLAERSASGLSPAELSSAYATVENWFGLAAGALRLTPPDLTNLDELSSVSADAIQVAIANAAFLALVNDNAQWDSISDVLADVTSQVSATGQISVMGDGTNVGLADLVSAAALQSSGLQYSVDSSVISQKLVVVEYRNVQRFKTIADVIEDNITGVANAGEASDETSVGGVTVGLAPGVITDSPADSDAQPTTDTSTGTIGNQVADLTESEASEGTVAGVAGSGVIGSVSGGSGTIGSVASGTGTVDPGTIGTGTVDSGDSGAGIVDSGTIGSGIIESGTIETVDGTTGDDSNSGVVADAGTDSEISEPPTMETSPVEAAPEEIFPANSALLSWTAPLTRENGESLAMGEIAGFEVVYGTSAEDLDQSLAIGDASIDELLVDELTEGTWYFAIRTLDTDGNRSRQSEVVYKQI